MRKKILIVLFIITSILLIFIGYNFTNKVTNFNKHKEYFNKPITEQNIQDWMPINYIERRYLIDFEKAVWKSISLWNMNITLKEYCKKNKINCDELIISLEKYKNGH